MRRFAAVAATIALLAGLGVAPVTLARFTATKSAAATFSTAALLAPTGLGATGGSSVGLTWTASASSTATGYQVLRSSTSGSGYAQVGTVTPVSATSTTDAPSTGTWYYVLQTYLQGWTSGYSNEASVAVASTTSTGLKPCVNNAAETSNAGDNNGYESNPGNACLQDGLFAVDSNSGTSTTNSCTASTKDKHRFWGYAFGLPTTVSSFTGVTVSARVDQTNNGGTTWMCVQLSWDGGGTWSAAKQVVLSSNSPTTYTFGGPTDTWGRTWVRENFIPANFRVRVIDSSTQSAKDFRLDYLGVSVDYTP